MVYGLDLDQGSYLSGLRDACLTPILVVYVQGQKRDSSFWKGDKIQHVELPSNLPPPSPNTPCPKPLPLGQLTGSGAGCWSWQWAANTA